MMMRVPQCPDQQCCQQKVSQAQFLCQPLLWLLSPSSPFLFVLWEDETTTMLSPSMPCSWRLDLAVSQKQDKGQGGIGALKHTSPKSLLCQAQETQQFEKKMLPWDGLLETSVPLHLQIASPYFPRDQETHPWTCGVPRQCQNDNKNISPLPILLLFLKMI